MSLILESFDINKAAYNAMCCILMFQIIPDSIDFEIDSDIPAAPAMIFSRFDFLVCKIYFRGITAYIY